VSCGQSETVDAFVGCINSTYGTHFPRESELPPGSSIERLYASPIARFVKKPGYLYWGEVGPPWTVFSSPTTFTVAALVYATGGEAEPLGGLWSRLRDRVRGRRTQP
jgi:hypothetical protein